MQDIPADTEKRGPSSRVLQEVIRQAPAEYVTEGERVVAFGGYSGTYKATGRSFNAPFAHLWTVRGGAITSRTE